MGLVLSSSEDFNFGKYQINDADVTRQNLKEYVKQNEKKLIYELLGIELGDLFIADLDADKKPQTQRFIKIFEPLAFNFGHKLIMSDGIKELLQGFVFSEFVKEQNFKNNINGSGKGLYPQGDVISANFAGIMLANIIMQLIHFGLFSFILMKIKQIIRSLKVHVNIILA